MRIGHGYDVHRLVEDRDLILGGVKIPYALGLLGHSDADVLLHAVSDALLGAAGLGDIVGEKVREAGYRISNIDVTMIAQAPKLRPHIETMERNIAAALGLDASRINVKATTEERLGFTGNMEGLACHAVCLLEE